MDGMRGTDGLARGARRATTLCEQSLVVGVLLVAGAAAADRALVIAAAAALCAFGTAALAACLELRTAVDAAIAAGRADPSLPAVARRLAALRAPRHRRALRRGLETRMARAADRELAESYARILLGLERAGEALEPAALARIELLLTRAAGPAAGGGAPLREEARRLAAQLAASAPARR
jgi:hypothetical protein